MCLGAQRPSVTVVMVEFSVNRVHRLGVFLTEDAQGYLVDVDGGVVVAVKMGSAISVVVTGVVPAAARWTQ